MNNLGYFGYFSASLSSNNLSYCLGREELTHSKPPRIIFLKANSFLLGSSLPLFALKKLMTKKRKQYQLIGTIHYAWLGQSKSLRWKNQPFYSLEVELESLFSKKKTSIYVFPNLVRKAIWNTLQTETFEGKKYLFWCEKRVRGWRLREWEEIN